MIIGKSYRGHNNTLSREYNKKLVLRILLDKGPLTRRDMSDLTGLTHAGLSNVVRELVREGIVRELDTEQPASGPGRPSVLVDLAPRSRLAVGVSIGLNSIDIGLVDLRGQVIFDARIPTLAQQGPDQVIARIAQCINDLRKTCPSRNILGVGVSAPGYILGEQGLVVQCPRLGWENLPLAAMLKEQVDLAVMIEKDIYCLTLAESLFCADRDSKHLLVISISDNIHAGIVVGGKVYRGANLHAGELGHIALEPKGPVCKCGKVGCLNTLATTGAIIEEASKFLSVKPHELTLSDVRNLAENGNSQCQDLLRKVGQLLGRAIADFATLLNPEVIILSGEVIFSGGDLVRESLLAECTALTYEMAKKRLQIRRSTFGLHAGIIGGATLIYANSVYAEPNSLATA